MDHVQGSATAMQLGEFKLAVKPGSLPVEIATVELAVGQPQREFESTTADMTSLRSIASRTGGAVISPVDSADVLKQIPDRSIPVLSTQSEELWSKPIALILVVLLATIEWLIRKSAGLI